MTDQEFVNKYYPYAERINREYNLKFSPYFWLGQWSLESANGTNKWTTQGNNVSASNVTNGAKTPVVKSGRGQNYFPDLESWYNNLVKNILNLGGSSTYSRAGFKEATTIRQAADRIVAGGYVGGSDPNKAIYAQSVTSRAEQLMKNTKPPTGSKIFPESSTTKERPLNILDEANDPLLNNTNITDREESTGIFAELESLDQYLTIKNILLYFVGLVLGLFIIRYINNRKEE